MKKILLVLSTALFALIFVFGFSINTVNAVIAPNSTFTIDQIITKLTTGNIITTSQVDKVRSLFYGGINPIPGEKSTPTIKTLSKGTLKLTYDSSKKESLLSGTQRVSVTAGTTDALMTWCSLGFENSEKIATPHGLAPNDTTHSFTAVSGATKEILKVDGSNETVWRVKAGKTAQFDVSIAASPKDMYPGRYSIFLKGATHIEGNEWVGSDIKNPIFSDIVTIVGEKANSSDTYTLETSPVYTAPGSPVTLTWTAPSSRSSHPKDWVGLYKAGDSDKKFVSWQYTKGLAKGTFTTSAPTTGPYDFRYFLDDGYTKVASVGISVSQAPSVGYASPTSGSIGSQVSIIGKGFNTLGSDGGISSGNYVLIDDKLASGLIFTTDSNSLIFTVPEGLSIPCGLFMTTFAACPVGTSLLSPGKHQLSVITANGTSNSISFVVDAKKEAKPSISIINPNGGGYYSNDGSAIDVTWKTENVPTNQKFDVVRLREYPNGKEYNLVSGLVNDGNEKISIPKTVPVGVYTLEIKGYVNGVLVTDSSDSYFKIINSVSDTCVPNKNAICNAMYAPVCGSDGQTYSNSCAAKAQCITDYTEGACLKAVLPKVAESVSCKFDAAKYSDFYPDLKKAFGSDAAKLKTHWITYGMAEGRTPCGDIMSSCKFDGATYVNFYPDLVKAKVDGKKHYVTYGLSENRDVCRKEVSSSASLNQNLKPGTEGQQVTVLQQALKQIGLYSGEITGFFGDLTKKSVMKFQTANSLDAVGEVGPKTRDLLNFVLSR